LSIAHVYGFLAEVPVRVKSVVVFVLGVVLLLCLKPGVCAICGLLMPEREAWLGPSVWRGNAIDHIVHALLVRNQAGVLGHSLLWIVWLVGDWLACFRGEWHTLSGLFFDHCQMDVVNGEHLALVGDQGVRCLVQIA